MRQTSGNADFVQALQSDAPDADLLTELARPLDAANTAPHVETAVRLLINVKPNWPWAAFCESLETFVNGHGGGERGTVVALTCLGLLRNTETTQARERLRSLSEGGLLLQRLGEVTGTGDVSLEIPLAALILLESATYAAAKNAGHAQSGVGEFSNLRDKLAANPAFVTALDKQVDEFGQPRNLPFLIEATTTNPDFSALVRLIFETRIDADNFAELTPAIVCENIATYLSDLDEPRQRVLLRKLASQTDFWEQIAALPQKDNAFLVYRLLLQDADEVGRSAQDALIAYLRTGSAEIWLKSYNSAAEPYSLLQLLRSKHEQPIDLGQALFSTLVGEINNLPTCPAEQIIRWFYLASCVGASNRGTLFTNLRDTMFTNIELSQILGVLTAGGAELLSVGRFAADSDRAARHIVLRLLDTETGRDWLTIHSSEGAAWIAAAHWETRDSIQARFQALFAAEDSEDARATLNIFSGALGLDAGVVAQLIDPPQQAD